MRRAFLLSAVVLLGLAATKATAVLAQSLDSRIIRIVVPAASTAPPDIVSRIIANELSNREGWRVIVENRPGAGGIVAGNDVLRQPADGTWRFGKPRKPFYVVVSKDDQAIRFSSTIAGGKSRLGDDANVEELAALGVTVIDLTDVKGTDSSNHSKYAQLAEVAPQLLAVLARGVGASPESGGRQPGGATLGDILETPVTLLGAPVKIISGQQ